MEKYGDHGYTNDGFGNSVAAPPEYNASYVEQQPTTTSSAGVDTSGFGMHSSGTGSGVITGGYGIGGGILPADDYQYATAIQTKLPSAHYYPQYGTTIQTQTPPADYYNVVTSPKLVSADSGAAGMTHEYGQYVEETHHEKKKGLMERIKDKLPGHHHNHH